LDHLYRQN